MQNSLEIRSSFKLLMLATGLTVILSLVTLAGLITYPFSIFGTFIHETGVGALLRGLLHESASARL